MAAPISRNQIVSNTPARSADMNNEFDTIVDAYNTLADEHNTQQTSINTLEASLGSARLATMTKNVLTWVDADTLGFAVEFLSLQNVNDADDGILISSPTFADIDITDATDGTLDNLLPVNTIAAEAASTWYYVWATCDSAGASPTLYYSLNHDYATVSGEVPPDVSYIRRVGAVYNNTGSDFLRFFQPKGTHDIEYDTAIEVLTHADGAWTTAYTAGDFSDMVPPTSASGACQFYGTLIMGTAVDGTYKIELRVSHDAVATSYWTALRLSGYAHTGGTPAPNECVVVNDFSFAFEDITAREVYVSTQEPTTTGTLTSGAWTLFCRGYTDGL
jgi:hypothetical protein